MLRSFLLAALAVVASPLALLADKPLKFESEMLFLRYHHPSGVGTNNIFNLDAAPRFALSKVFSYNVGGRVTYFDYRTEATDAVAGRTGLDTYNLDFEVFKNINLSSLTALEMSAGLRYNDTEYFYNGPANPNDFTGLGGLFGVRVGFRVFEHGMIYSRMKFALLGGNGGHDSNVGALPKAFDMGRQQTELALGYQHNMCLGRFNIVPHFGAEWQNWQGFAIDPVDEHPESDIMLGGLTTGVTVCF